MAEFEQFILYLAGALLAVAVGSRLTNRGQTTGSADIHDDTLVVLIGADGIIDANFQARRLIAQAGGALSDLDQLLLFLSQHFEEARRLIAAGEAEDDVIAQSRDGRMQAVKQTVGGRARLTIRFVQSGDPSANDIHSLRAMESELKTLRANTFSAPFLLWRQNADGEIVWVNQAYLNAAASLKDGKSTDWPLPTLFKDLRKVRPPVARETRRMSISPSGDGPAAWYDCHIAPVGDDVLLTALPADEAVQAEGRRREFTQTLTKTFAELAIGLAIFDRSRQLVLFNPALMDLTNLATDFLTSRPTLIGFLDQLRENRIMPEPRDYRSWRSSIAELEAAAVDGTYSETWSLPDGQTYHVTGRPHPDGAVALLFEDISAEMSLTRHFRSELEQFQDIVDAFDEAVAVFSPAGDMTMTNRAYRELWGIAEDEFLVGDLTEALRKWHDLSAPTPIWGDFRDFAQGNTDREEWTAKVALRDGRRLACRFSPTKGGATMVMFRVETLDAASRLQATG